EWRRPSNPGRRGPRCIRPSSPAPTSSTAIDRPEPPMSVNAPPPFSRREALKVASSGFGYLAFAGLSAWASEKAAGPLAPKAPPLPARAKRVIFLCMEGGPAHVDTFDYKPRLAADHGKEIGKGRVPSARLLASPWAFHQHGESGLWVSELFPEVA